MNIQRQYNRPNCSLVLEGFDETGEGNSSVISILTNAQCNFVASNQQLSGGRDFLENLASAVNSYAQEFLSGLSHPQDSQKDYPQVEVTPEDAARLHCITLKPKPEEGATEQKVTVTTTELFDLVEAIDCFYGDASTLPDVRQNIDVVGKRYRQPEEPLAQRVVPLLAGAVSLAAAAGLFFVLPVPRVSEPEPAIETLPLETLPTTPESGTAPGTEPNSDILNPEPTTEDSE